MWFRLGSILDCNFRLDSVPQTKTFAIFLGNFPSDIKMSYKRWVDCESFAWDVYCVVVKISFTFETSFEQRVRDISYWVRKCFFRIYINWKWYLGVLKLYQIVPDSSKNSVLNESPTLNWIFGLSKCSGGNFTCWIVDLFEVSFRFIIY